MYNIVLLHIIQSFSDHSMLSGQPTNSRPIKFQRILSQFYSNQTYDWKFPVKWPRKKNFFHNLQPASFSSKWTQVLQKRSSHSTALTRWKRGAQVQRGAGKQFLESVHRCRGRRIIYLERSETRIVVTLIRCSPRSRRYPVFTSIVSTGLWLLGDHVDFIPRQQHLHLKRYPRSRSQESSCF